MNDEIKNNSAEDTSGHFPINDKRLCVTMPNGDRYAIPIAFIAMHRAMNYKHEFDGSEARSLNEDTLPLFQQDNWEIIDWARNNLNWKDVKHIAQRLGTEKPVDFQLGWTEGEMGIIDMDHG